ncbi:major facilitator superfamily domain-containing protein [Yarrowia lipolytica]|nr:major facilitator superfamily domain-containing protein [Yarrowia lipolytica]RDW51930.1 major facilitator superfamily domain-containing protein [Yarrowia lipolytica]
MEKIGHKQKIWGERLEKLICFHPWVRAIFFSKAQIKHYPKRGSSTNAKERGWTRPIIIVGWIFVYLYAASKELAEKVHPTMAPLATSHFAGLSLLSSKAVVQSSIFIVTRPAFAKVCDHIGRLEGWVIVVLCHLVGSVLFASAPNTGCYFAGIVFWEVATVGGHMMTELYASDTSTINTRIIFSSFIQSPNIWGPYAAAPIVGAILDVATWRWGYGMFAIVIPVCSLGVLFLFSVMRVKEFRLGARGDFYTPGGFKRFLLSFDIVGLVMLCAGTILLFFPITLAEGTDKWSRPGFIAMLTIGSFLLAAFPLWEIYGAQSPLISWKLFRNRAMICSCIILFFSSMSNKLSVPYYITWLLVVRGYSPKATTNINSAVTVANNAFGILFAAPYLLWSGKPKHMMVLGTCLYLVGTGLTYRFRRQHSGLGILIISQVIEGIGRGTLYIPCGTIAQAMFDKHKVAKVTAVYFTMGGIGQLVGDAILGAIYKEVYPQYIHKYAPDIPQKDLNLIINKIKKATKFPIGSPVRNEINRAFDETMKHMLYGTFACAAMMFLAVLCYPSVDFKEQGSVSVDEGEDIEPDDYRIEVRSQSDTELSESPSEKLEDPHFGSCKGQEEKLKK